MGVPPYLERTLSILECAYPQGMPDEDYLPVMRVLREGMSVRNLGDVMFAFTTFLEARHDAYGVAGTWSRPIRRCGGSGNDSWSVDGTPTPTNRPGRTCAGPAERRRTCIRFPWWW